MKLKLLFAVLAIFLLGSFLRFNQLGLIPAGLNQDETAIGYNAYSILQTGRDEHGVSWPLYFKSFNDYKLPVYIYMTAISENIFGVDAYAVRFPSALFGSLAIIGLFLLVKELTKNNNLALLSGFLLAINPWHVFFSRIGFEVNVAVTCSLFGVLFFVYAVNRKNNIFLYILSLLFFTLSAYTYNITRIHSPILLFSLVFLFWKKFFSMGKWKVGLICILFIVLEIPFVLTLFSHSGLSYQTSIMITGGNAKAENVEFRSYLTMLPHWFSAIFFNSYVLVFWEYCKNIVASLSSPFFFTSAGTQTGDINVGDMGMFYPIEFFTIIIGFIVIMKEKIKSLYVFIFWAVTLFLLVSISAVVPTGTRSFSAVIPLTVFSAYGLLRANTYVKKLYPKYGKIFLILLIICFGYGFIYFQTSYYFRFPVFYVTWWRTQDKDLALYLKSQENNYSHIVFDSNVDFIYTSLVFYQQYPPAQYQHDVIYNKTSLFTSISRLGKYTFRSEKINWDDELNVRDTLFVTEPDNLPRYTVKEKTFFYPTRPVVLSVENSISQYPYTQPVFVVVLQK